MARFMRLEVINTVLDIGLIPLFYTGDVETAIEVISACARGGARVIEFTNRGEMAYPVFTELVKHFAKADPSIMLGVGSIMDAPTAALYLASGANFIVGPSFNPEDREAVQSPQDSLHARLGHRDRNRNSGRIWRGNLQNLSRRHAGWPGFIKAVMAPCPWHRLLPTGGVDATEASIGEWIKAGAAAVGLGSKLITSEAVKERDFDSIAKKVAQCVGWIQKARGRYRRDRRCDQMCSRDVDEMVQRRSRHEISCTVDSK